MVFVNFAAFVLHDLGSSEQIILDLFWKQLE